MDELNLIDYITGRPIDTQDMESIQQAIDALQSALNCAFKVRDAIKEER